MTTNIERFMKDDIKIEDKYSALLHSRWKVKSPGHIEGEWAEDGNTFEIIVPCQLTEMMVEMQNVLADSYDDIKQLESDLKLKKETFTSILWR